MAWAIIGVLAGLAAAGCGGGAHHAARTPARQVAAVSNPVLAGDHPDPSVVAAPPGFLMGTTGARAGPLFPLFASADLVHWHGAGVLFRRPPAWSAGVYWAPQLVRLHGRWLAYYSARLRGAKPCIAVAVAARAGGPYRDRGPIVCQPRGSIDPVAFSDDRGGGVLMWKQMGFGGPLLARRLSADGTRLAGARHIALRPGAPWEGRVTEGPSILHRGGWYYLFYSGGLCCSQPCTYATGVARSRSPLGPYAKSPANPILVSSRRWLCPGGGSILDRGARAAPLLFFQAYARGEASRAREVLLAPVRFGAAGWPYVPGRVPPREVLARPRA